MNTPTTLCTISLIALIAGSTIASAAERDVQFTDILADDHVLMLSNTGASAVDLDGWRFCSHNTTQVRRYTAPTAFNGVTLQPGDELLIYLDNDAPFGNPLAYDAFDIGFFANFELNAYAVSFYFTNSGGSTPFNDGNFIADHLQWSIDGVDHNTADERSDEAENGGVWTNQSEWISVASDTTLIELDDPTFAHLHGPADYNVVGGCQADITGDGELNFFDVSAFLSAFAAQNPTADFTGDGLYNFFDVSSFLSQFSAGCP